VEAEVLSLANNIRAQCFQHAENFVSGDIRYQGFEDLEGKGKGMITFNRRKASLFEVDVAIGCLLGFYLGNGIQAHSGRAYKWCPFWGKMGATSVRLTSITRAYDHYAKSRMMILLLLFLQKQSLAFAVYLFGIGTLHTGPGLKKKTHVIMLSP
jgi:hypothetical protein